MSGIARTVAGTAVAGLTLLGCAEQSDHGAILGTGTAPPDSPIARVEAGLVPLTEDGQPLWDERATLADRMRSYAVPGIGVAVIDGFEIGWSRGYGTVRAGSDNPVTAETLFHAGSVAKVVSAAAVLTLVAEGRLELDRDVNELLQSWRLPESEFARQEKVTLRRLLSHTAGLEDGLSGRSSADAVPGYATPAGEAPTVGLQDLLDAPPGVDADGPTRVTAVPGSSYRYANADYVIVELLARDVTEQSFASFMADRVLGPLEMRSSTYEQPLPPDLRPRAAVEHDRSGRPFPGDRLHFPMVAAGGLWTTPSDLARFAIEVLRAYRGESERLLPAPLAREMLTSQIEIRDNPLADKSGLGFHMGGTGESLYIVHTGGTWGSTSLLWAYPGTGQGAVIMTNSATGSFLRIELLLAIAREYGWPLGP